MPGMTSLERCLTVLNGGIPDRVPVCLENFQHAAAVAGYTLREYCLDGEKMAAAHMAAWEKFGHDMIDLENGVATLAGAAGCELRYADDAPPWITRHVLHTIEEVDRLKPIDPYQDGTLPEVIKATRILAKELGGQVCLLIEADQGPFDLAAELIDPQELLMSLLDPEKEEWTMRPLEIVLAGRGYDITAAGEKRGGASWLKHGRAPRPHEIIAEEEDVSGASQASVRAPSGPDK